MVGDSLSAAYGISPDRGWVALLERRLRERDPGWTVVNAAVSGDTTRGALARLPAALERHRPILVVIELGGNDGLRGIALEEVEANLGALARAAQAAGARVAIVPVPLPPNYGPTYVGRFAEVFARVAAATGAALSGDILAGVADDPALMQADGIHPVEAAQQRMLDNVWPSLQPLLD